MQRLKINLTAVLACASLGISLFIPCKSALAHEFWLVPVATPQRVGDTAALSLQVGEFFQGDDLGFSNAQTVTLKLYTASSVKDLRPQLSLLTLGKSIATFKLPLNQAGAHVVVYDSQPSVISLPADKFHAYLHDEGLDFIKTRREALGQALKPGRERYRRFVKTLINATDPTSATHPELDASDAVVTRSTGQRLELLPLNNPFKLTPGGALSLRVLFEGQPLAGALVKAWHRRSGQTITVRATTNPAGEVQLDLPYAGPWMVSAVHMVAAQGNDDIDWDSLWGNLSFSLPEAPSVNDDTLKK